MDKEYTNTRFETPPDIVAQDGTPVGKLPEEIVAYYLDHDYGKKGIPLSVKTIQDIAKILTTNPSDNSIYPEYILSPTRRTTYGNYHQTGRRTH